MFYIASFSPQAWISDQAVEVDAEGPVSWDCSAVVDAEMLTYLNRLGELAGESLDDGFGILDAHDRLKDDPAAPEWIRDWRGPFSIRVEETAAAVVL